MPLTEAEVKTLEANKSSYGCGNTTCKDCYPIQYGCDYCNKTFEAPIANGEDYSCAECGYDNAESKAR